MADNDKSTTRYTSDVEFQWPAFAILARQIIQAVRKQERF